MEEKELNWTRKIERKWRKKSIKTTKQREEEEERENYERESENEKSKV